MVATTISVLHIHITYYMDNILYLLAVWSNFSTRCIFEEYLHIWQQTGSVWVWMFYCYWSSCWNKSLLEYYSCKSVNVYEKKWRVVKCISSIDKIHIYIQSVFFTWFYPGVDFPSVCAMYAHLANLPFIIACHMTSDQSNNANSVHFGV